MWRILRRKPSYEGKTLQVLNCSDNARELAANGIAGIAAEAYGEHTHTLRNQRSVAEELEECRYSAPLDVGLPPFVPTAGWPISTSMGVHIHRMEQVFDRDRPPESRNQRTRTEMTLALARISKITDDMVPQLRRKSAPPKKLSAFYD